MEKSSVPHAIIPEESEALRLAHHFFDFNWRDWREYWDGSLRLDPFQEKRWRFWTRDVAWAPSSADSARSQLREQANIFPNSMRSLSPQEVEFPKLLLDSPDCPALLYVQGGKIPQGNHLIATVGTRKPSRLGLATAMEFSRDLARAQGNLGIASGLAKGIDGICHQEALRAGIYTLAVLGHGLDRIYPRQHRTLAQEIIAAQGTLITEYPWGVAPLPQHFPRRNQIIAGIAAGVVVIEGAESSGAAITAKAALKLGRAAVVFPQDFTSEYGAGAIALLQQGAEAAFDTLDTLRLLASAWNGELAGSVPASRRVKTDFIERVSARELQLKKTRATIHDFLNADPFALASISPR